MITTTSTTHTSKVMVPGAVREPRGAAWATAVIGTVGEGLAAIGTLVRMELSAAKPLALAVWHHLEKVGETRARRDLLALARRRESDNPGFAEDLRAAALWRSGAAQATQRARKA
jgi:hypothetical protein